MKELKRILLNTTMRRKVVPIIIIVLLITSIYLALPWIFTEAPRKFLLEVKVVRNGKLVPALVYARMLYPEGMRPGGGYVAPKGVAWIWIDHETWKRAWDEERKRTGFFADPTIIITAFTEDNYVGLLPVVLKWEELKPYALGGKKTVTIEPNIKRVKGRPIKIQEGPSSGSGDVPVLVDEYEKTRRVTLGLVYFDPNIGEGCGSLFMCYYYYKKVGISLAFAFMSREDWEICFNVFRVGSEQPGVAATVANSDNPEGHISIVVTYRFEHWKYEDPVSGEVYDEEYDMWIKNFYPNTMSNETGECVEIHYWFLKYWGYGKGINEPTYQKYGFQVDGHDFAVDLLWFAELLIAIGEMIAEASTWANFIFLFVNLDIGATYAFSYDLEYVIPKDVYVLIHKGRHEFEGELHNVLYWKVKKV